MPGEGAICGHLTSTCQRPSLAAAAGAAGERLWSRRASCPGPIPAGRVGQPSSTSEFAAQIGTMCLLVGIELDRVNVRRRCTRWLLTADRSGVAGHCAGERARQFWGLGEAAGCAGS
jgi:hypothetical protein